MPFCFLEAEIERRRLVLCVYLPFKGISDDVMVKERYIIVHPCGGHKENGNRGGL